MIKLTRRATNPKLAVLGKIFVSPVDLKLLQMIGFIDHRKALDAKKPKILIRSPR